MSTSQRSSVGIYIDEANIRRNGGYGLKYDVLREFVCHDGAEPVRLNVYATFDPKRAHEDQVYKVKTNSFFAMLRDMGYKVIIKNCKWYTDEEGKSYAKANSDLDMAVDALLQSENLDRVVMCTGDGDFVQVVRALQNKGCRVEVLAFDNVSADLRREADVFFSGYLIPKLLPTRSTVASGLIKEWGEEGSRVRGICYAYKHEGKYGFLRFLENLSGNTWITDTRHPQSPYAAVYFSESELPREVAPMKLPNHELIFEFDLHIQEHNKERKLQARNMQVVSGLDYYTQTSQVFETIPKEMRRGDRSVAPTSQTSSQT